MTKPQIEIPTSLIAPERPAEKTQGRNRDWERQQREDPETCQVTIRGMPRDLWALIKDLAGTRGITVSQMTVELLHAGTLILNKLGQLWISEDEE